MHVGDALYHPVPVAHQLRGHAQGHNGDPKPVGEGVIHRRLVFAVRAELGPIVGDGHGVIHQSALSLDVQRHGRHRLGDGEHRKERVSIDLPPSGCIGEATPDIDDLFAIHIGHYLQANLAAFANGGVNGFLDNAIRVRCHSSPSRSFLEQPICPSSHSLSLQETPSLPLSFSTCASATSACGSQNVISMARYISIAVDSSARAGSRWPVLAYSVPRPRWQWAWSGRMPSSSARVRAWRKWASASSASGGSRCTATSPRSRDAWAW